MMHRPKREFCKGIKIIENYEYLLIFSIQLSNIFPTQFDYGRRLSTLARILLSRAVELWLALARLEVPERAKAVLNKARKAVHLS